MEKMSVALKALLCVKALGQEFDEGVEILERCGWDYSNRFELPATIFVDNLVNQAIEYESVSNNS